MSNPGRQMNTRRLPPLPGLGFNVSRRGPSPQGNSLHSSSPTYSLKSSQSSSNGKKLHTDMCVTGQPINNHHSGTLSDRTLNQELTNESVAAYLDSNQEFLDQYVATHCHRDQVEAWLAKKKQNHKPSKHKHNNGTVNDENQSDSKVDWFRWKLCHKSERKQIVQEWLHELHQQPNKSMLLHELASCIAAIVEADGFNLYFVKENTKELVLHTTIPNSAKHSSSSQRIESGTTLAAYVAHIGESVWTHDVLSNEKFPKGVGPVESGHKVQCAIAHPVQVSGGQTIGVIEMYRFSSSQTFTTSNEEISHALTIWGSIAVYYTELYHTMAKQRTLNDFLLTVTKSIFQDIVSMDTVIMKIMNFAQRLVSADRASLFLVDSSTHELYARIFDVGQSRDLPEGLQDDAEQTEIRFPMDKGVAGHVASTGDILNIPDAYADDRFNRNVDIQTGYKTRTILCMPIYIRGSIIGVVQMVNKLNGLFTKADEQSFQTFAVYCGLALHHAKLYDKIRRSEQKYKVALEVLSYHNQPQAFELEKLKSYVIPEEIPNLIEYQFSPWDVIGDDKPVYVIYMFKDLFNLNSNAKEPRFDLVNLLKFTLTVRKNYRNVPYHNWEHAFSVAHAMYTLIKTTNNAFSSLEYLGLFVACLCHDLDHRGKTNSFMVKSASPLAAIYTTSTMEHHHFNQTVAILQQDGNNIFKHLTSDEYKTVLGDIKHCILATDLALFFGNKARLDDMLQKKDFSWERKEHRKLSQAIAMTACDLCASIKPWEVQVKTVQVIFQEFYAQGDEEKANGVEPTPMMDRAKADLLPVNQVGFLEGICLPCYELLARILPATQPMVDGARDNLVQWKKLAKKRKEERDACATAE